MIARLLGAGIIGAKTRINLSNEGRGLKTKIEALGIPRMWGKLPPELFDEFQQWRERCASTDLSQAGVYTPLDRDHTTGAEALLVIDEILPALDPPGSVGG